MIPRELTEGVRKLLERGATRELVRSFLLERGWTENDARDVFAQIDRDTPVNNTQNQEEKEKEGTLAVLVPTHSVLATTTVSHPLVVKPPAHPEIKKDPVVSHLSVAPVVPTLERLEKKPPLQSPIKAPALTTSRKGESFQSRPNQEFATARKEVPEPKNARATTDLSPAVKPVSEVNKQVGSIRKPDGSGVARQKEATRHPKKERSQESHDEASETELFEVGALSSPLSLVSVALASTKQHFWSLFFLSFMVSVVGLILYVVLSYVITPERLVKLSELVIAGDVNIFLISPLIVCAFMCASAFVLTILLWLPSAYILALSGRKSSFRDLFIGGFVGAFSLLVSSVFVLLFITSGLLILLVPGVVLAVWFVFAPIISVVERVSPFVSLLISRELVRNYFWAVLLRETFLLIPIFIFCLLFVLLLSPLALLESLNLTIGFIVALFVLFGALLFLFATLIFFFAYRVAFYKELRARIQTVKLSGGLVRALPFLLVVPLIASIAVAIYATSRIYV